MANGKQPTSEELMNANRSYSEDSIAEDRKTADKKIESLYNALETPSIVSEIRKRLELSERSRYIRENQWLKNTNSYRGIDGGETPFRTESEKSKVYVRTTTVKVKAAYAQIVEALFSDNKFPISIQPTIVPEGVSEWAHVKGDMESDKSSEEALAEANEQKDKGPVGGIGFAGDGLTVAPGATRTNLSFLGGLEDNYLDPEGNNVLEEGYSNAEGAINVNPAKQLARNMEKVIHDHLEESKARTHVRKAIHEMCLLGTGIVKGPFNINKEIPNWVSNEETGEMEYKPIIRKSFQCSHVSSWNFYPDPNALSGSDMEWAIERHRMQSQQVSELRSRPQFSGKAIDRLLSSKGNYTHRRYETNLEEENNTPEAISDLYEVLEYWGYMDKKMLEEFNLPTDTMIGDRVQVNLWVSGDEVLRAVINPFLPQRIPYYVVPYEADPWTIWGTGVPESMEDSQTLMNGFMRLAVDNLALSGNMVFDVDDSMLEPGQDMEISPGKIFRRRAGGPGSAISGLSFPNTAPANMEMFRQVRQIADEETGIPSFAHGQTGITSPTRTASGMSMLLQNASLNIKTVIRNIDDELLKPLGEGYYRSEMQFNGRKDIRGDLEIRAMGSSSLQAKEVRSNRLNTFLQLAANPALAPLIKFPTVLRELAISMEMDPDEILNNPEEQEIYAKLMGMQSAAPQPGAAPGAQPPGMPPGMVPSPNDPSFTGNNVGAGNPEGANGIPPQGGAMPPGMSL